MFCPIQPSSSCFCRVKLVFCSSSLGMNGPICLTLHHHDPLQAEGHIYLDSDGIYSFPSTPRLSSFPLTLSNVNYYNDNKEERGAINSEVHPVTFITASKKIRGSRQTTYMLFCS